MRTRTQHSILFSLLCFLCGAAKAAAPDGYVVQVESATVYLDWGKASGVQAGDRFDLFREGKTLKHPVTGEVLGKEEDPVGSGTLQNVEGKFAIGHLDSVKLSPRVGDRTRWVGPSISMAAAAPLISSGAVVTEIWRSDPLEKNPLGITFIDLDGDGRQDIIVAYEKKIVAYRYNDKKLDVLATFKSSRFHRCLMVDAIESPQDGHVDVLATMFSDGINVAHVLVLRYEKGNFNQIADLEGLARVISRADGSRHLYWQNLTRLRELRYVDAAELKWDKKTYKPGRSLDLKVYPDQLFGFVWGDWFKSGGENLAVLEHGERLAVTSSDSKWRSPEVYGGTKNDFPMDPNTMGVVYPRLFSWRPAAGDREQLIVPTNNPSFGVHTTFLKVFKQADIEGLEWNGADMRPVWHIKIDGYLADYGIADVLGLSRPQLWAATSGSDNKAVLVSYALP